MIGEIREWRCEGRLAGTPCCVWREPSWRLAAHSSQY